jgi:hypothetical protein
VAASFSLAGLLRVVPSWVDELSTTALTDSVTALIPFTLTDGTAAGQANGYYKDVITIAAGGTATVDLRALPLVFMGGTGTLSLASVKVLLIRNRSTTASLSAGVSVTHRWTALSADSIAIGPEGVLYTTHLAAGLATTTTNKVLAITNNGAAAADLELYIVGVKV